MDFSPVFTFTIANLVNPSSARVISDFTAKSYNGNTLIFTDTLTAFTYQPITINTCSMSSASTTVGDSATVSINCDIVNDIPGDGIIFFSVPKWVGSDYGASIPESMLSDISGCAAA